MNYKEALKQFAKRPKKADVKMIFPYTELRLQEDSSLLFSRKLTKWEKDGKGGWRNAGTESKPIFVLREDNTLELLCDTATNEYTVRNLWMKVDPASTVYSDSSGYAQHEHKIRYLRVAYPHNPNILKVDVPFVKGLRVNVTTGQVIASVPDVIKKTNIRKCKPVYDFTRKVVQVMKVMHRVGAFEDKGHRWHYDHKALGKLPGDMTEDSLATLAEAAFTAAKRNTMGVSANVWGTTVDPITGNSTYGIISTTPEHEIKARYEKRLFINAGKYLRNHFKKAHDSFDVEIVNHT